MATNNLAFDNFFSTTLSSTITASDTTVYLNALPAASEGYLVIEPDSSSNREIIYYTSKGANFVTCPSAASGRGVGGTTAVSHNSGSTVQMNTVAEMFEEIQNGNANTGMHQYFDDSFADYIKSGGAITQATGLIASVSSGVSYINGRRLTFNAFSKTLTASKDTYFDLVETDGSNIATVSYTELSSGATGSAPVSNGVHLGMVRSNASLLATIYQTGFDRLGNYLKPTRATQVADSVDIVPTVDANGWRVYNFGTTKIYKKRITLSSTSVATTATNINSGLSSTNLPVGFTTIGSANFMDYTWTAQGNAGALVITFEGNTSNVALAFTATSTDSTRNYVGWIDVTFTVG